MENIRKDFPLLQYYPNLIYLDNAATTQKPHCVLQRILDYYQKENANIHRSVHFLGELATLHYEQARNTVARFLHAPSAKNIVFTRGTTESINLVAYSWGRTFLKKNMVILVSEIEHHANLIPWQVLAKELDLSLRYIPCRQDGSLDLDSLDSLIHENVGIISISYASNSLGCIHPVEMIITKAHKYNIPVLLDAAQMIPHREINVQKLDCDFLAFSGHKMCGPTGIGVLYAKESWLEKMIPFQTGGEMIRAVWMDHATYNDIPYKFEAGTPPICGAIALATAIEYLQNIGMDKIAHHSLKLRKYAWNALQNIDNVRLLGNQEDNVGILSFIYPKIHPHDLAQYLDEHNIAVRAGHHCAQPLLRKMGLTATTRISFYLYNDEQEIDILVEQIYKAKKFFLG
ncbi:MAG TPA: SufS family cysteine desulfurase [Planctomycetota bacterium]|mgnify:FL=1|nr:SufS family cysteine desulfurase [Planctomycetota bacterium]HRU50641.1 SufS family cysteine desulfurase [Planctomycetota bacterium]